MNINRAAASKNVVSYVVSAVVYGCLAAGLMYVVINN